MAETITLRIPPSYGVLFLFEGGTALFQDRFVRPEKRFRSRRCDKASTERSVEAPPRTSLEQASCGNMPTSKRRPGANRTRGAHHLSTALDTALDFAWLARFRLLVEPQRMWSLCPPAILAYPAASHSTWIALN
jgi:hypothetical protein